MGAQVVERDGGDFGPAKLAAGEHAAVAGDDVQPAVDEDGDVEAEGLDAGSDLLDLALGMQARVLRVELEVSERLDGDGGGGAGGSANGCGLVHGVFPGL